MTINQQRAILIVLYLIFAVVHPRVEIQTPAFPCEALLDNPIFELDFESVTESGRKTTFIEWVRSEYGAEVSAEGQRLLWEAGGLRYEANFDGAHLDVVGIDVSAYRATAGTITECLGRPSVDTTIAGQSSNSMMNIVYLYYHPLRLFAMGASSTDLPAGTRSPLDSSADVRMLWVYSPEAYQEEWRLTE